MNAVDPGRVGTQARSNGIRSDLKLIADLGMPIRP